MNTMNKMEDATGTQDPADYQSDAYVYQLDRDGSTLRTYRFHDVFPTNVSTIELNYESTDQYSGVHRRDASSVVGSHQGLWSQLRRGRYLLISPFIRITRWTPKGVLFLWSKYKCKTVYAPNFIIMSRLFRFLN